MFLFNFVEECLGVGLRAQKYPYNNKKIYIIYIQNKILKLWPLLYVASFKNINVPKMNKSCPVLHDTASPSGKIKSQFQNGQECLKDRVF